MTVELITTSTPAMTKSPSRQDNERPATSGRAGGLISTQAWNLDHTQFRVSSTADSGVVSSETRLVLAQRGIKILGRYSGGSIVRGYLVGALTGTVLQFRFTQREVAGQIHGGRSVCELERLANGRLRLHEHFTWTTRDGAGTNIFDQVADE